MTWEEAYAQLDMARLRGLIGKLAYEGGLLNRGHSVEGLLTDVLWLAWCNFDDYNPTRSAFYTWVVWKLRSLLSLYQRQAARTIPFGHLSGAGGRWRDPAPSPLERVIRQEEITEAQALIREIELVVASSEAPGSLGTPRRSRDTDLAVFRTYLKLLRDSGTVRTSQAEVAMELGITQQSVSAALRRIADACEKAGLCL